MLKWDIKPLTNNMMTLPVDWKSYPIVTYGAIVNYITQKTKLLKHLRVLPFFNN